LGGGVIQKNDRYKGGPCEKIGKLRGGHAIFKWWFPNPTRPPSLIKNERSLIQGLQVHSDKSCLSGTTASFESRELSLEGIFKALDRIIVFYVFWD